MSSKEQNGPEMSAQESESIEKLLKSLDDSMKNQEFQTSFSEEDFKAILDIANQPIPQETMSEEQLKKLLDSASSVDFKAPDEEQLKKLLDSVSSADFEIPEIDWSKWEGLLQQQEISQEPIPPPDPNLTEKDVAAWMLEQVTAHSELSQEDAAWHIRRYFGERFIYYNENSNVAISPQVLKEFKEISVDSVVWNRPERYWRKRQPGDPKGRIVDY